MKETSREMRYFNKKNSRWQHRQKLEEWKTLKKIQEVKAIWSKQEYGWITTIWSRTRIWMNYNNLEQNKNIDELQQFGAEQEYGWITTIWSSTRIWMNYNKKWIVYWKSEKENRKMRTSKKPCNQKSKIQARKEYSKKIIIVHQYLLLVFRSPHKSASGPYANDNLRPQMERFWAWNHGRGAYLQFCWRREHKSGDN